MWRFAGVDGVVEDESFKTKREAVSWMTMQHEGTAKLTRLSAGFYFALVTSDTGREIEYSVYKAGDDGVRPAHWYHGREEFEYVLASEYTERW